ncbi:hypothetical protein PRIPAC_75892 [Pristionchus pacificus]|uniref:Uncharacterized protein n=1 Tax=Pristionchus pacificus TaxID=54126 RepID=A0A2A6CRG5_PRIPA|nr:hypothetical protein PRIPAC_75892 [Pristionchus pacificus]|eukprot:PDM80795.1 hypothetical protein PRIPAC_35798 [Pristionchus pacificus]
MFLIAIGLILQIFSVNGKYPYGEPTNGKFVHNMRTFVNVTFEWISPLTENGTKIAEIPYCHEHRIRRTYYELPTPDISYEVMEQIAIRNKKKRQALSSILCLSPCTMKVPKSNMDISQQQYTEFTTSNIVEMKKLIELVIVSVDIWKLIWDQWTIAQDGGLQYCNGGDIFDQLLPLIYKDAESMPQYNEVVNLNYSVLFSVLNDYDITSNLCGLSEYCDCPRNKEEILTLAYPTEEGLQQFRRYRHAKNLNPLDRMAIVLLW